MKTNNTIFVGENKIPNSCNIQNCYIENCIFDENITISDLCLKNAVIKNNKKTAELEIKKEVKKIFGTDGIRGIWKKDFDENILINLAKSLCKKNFPKIIIGRDIRKSGEEIFDILSKKLCLFGAKVINIGIATTPAISFLTKKTNSDFGIMITASHNTKEFNGIKIFTKYGTKLFNEEEKQLEESFISTNINNHGLEGEIKTNKTLLKSYISAIKNYNDDTFEELKIVFDCANGSASKIIPKIFTDLHANIVPLFIEGEINENCGATHPEIIQNAVIKNNADIGFSFDGDADRVIAVNKKGQILDGDDMLFILAWHLKNLNKLKNNTVVGTILTNTGIENKLKAIGVKTERVQVGDKYIIEKLCKENFILGGEQSGHIIFKNFIESGDGILVARILTSIYKKNQHIFEYVKENNYSQTHKNIELYKEITQKERDEIQDIQAFFQQKLGNFGRIIIRESGTENKIRIIVESTNKNLNKFFCNEIKKRINKILKTENNLL